MFLISILGRIIRVTDDVVDYRRWIERNFPSPLGSVSSDLSISNLSNVEISAASLNNASNAKSSPPEERKAIKPRV